MKFAKTTYGKIVFINAYVPSFFVLICLIALLLFSTVIKYNLMLSSLSLFGAIVLAVVFITLFLKGNRYYYNELKDFIKEKTEQ
jgi:hypothetical protein